MEGNFTVDLDSFFDEDMDVENVIVTPVVSNNEDILADDNQCNNEAETSVTSNIPENHVLLVKNEMSADDFRFNINSLRSHIENEKEVRGPFQK